MLSRARCGDPKVIAPLRGLQSGFTKYCCFLCLWDSRDVHGLYNVKQWPSGEHFIPGKFNVKFGALVEANRVVFPQLHIKLRLIKSFVKLLNPLGQWCNN